MTDVGALLSLSPHQAQVVGGWAIALLVALDLLAAADDVPQNTPRDWIVWVTQWRSLWLWNRGQRAYALRAGRKRAHFNLLNYLPLTGAGAPFMCAVLVGHFFHPGIGPLIGPAGGWGLAATATIAVTVSGLTFFLRHGTGQRVLVWLALAGLLCGMAIWPAGA